MIDNRMAYLIALTVLAITNVAAGITLFHLLMLWKKRDHVYHYSWLDGIFEFGGMMEIAFFTFLIGVSLTGFENSPFLAGSGATTWIVSTVLVAVLNRLFVSRSTLVCLLAAFLSNIVAMGILHVLKRILAGLAA